MKHAHRYFVVLVALALFMGFLNAAGPMDGPVPPPGLKAEKPPAPSEISCLTVSMDGQEFHRDLLRPTPANAPGQIRSAFLRIGQEMQLFGSDAEKVKGARLVQAMLEGGGSYEVGRVCYVLMDYCAPSCTGQGCAKIRVPSIK